MRMKLRWLTSYLLLDQSFHDVIQLLEARSGYVLKGRGLKLQNNQNNFERNRLENQGHFCVHAVVRIGLLLFVWNNRGFSNGLENLNNLENILQMDKVVVPK